MQDLFSALDCAWLPAAPHAVRHAEQKTMQLGVAAALGFELPPTLITTSPADMLAFHRAHGGRIVSKQAGKSFFHTVGHSLIRYTELVTTRDLAHAGALAYCPITFQAYVDKQVELRVTVVGRQVFAAEIHSQTTNHTRHDWRRYDHGQTPHRAHELPRELEARCVALVEQLGLRYGAIDLVLMPDGRYVFLEINPNGQYLWTEYAAGLPISDAICELLCDDDRAPLPAAAMGGLR
jgi:glutathione synthase/RimK-type ligase-like ATP-grasp enzyme